MSIYHCPACQQETATNDPQASQWTCSTCYTSSGQLHKLVLSDKVDPADEEDLTDFLSDAINDSFDIDWDIDWTGSTGARAVINALKEEGLKIIRV